MQYPPYPEELAYLEGDLFNKYLEDMRIAQEYAQFNRKTMANCINREFVFVQPNKNQGRAMSNACQARFLSV